jgi:hypothetical protein
MTVKSSGVSSGVTSSGATGMLRTVVDDGDWNAESAMLPGDEASQEIPGSSTEQAESMDNRGYRGFQMDAIQGALPYDSGEMIKRRMPPNHLTRRAYKKPVAVPAGYSSGGGASSGGEDVQNNLKPRPPSLAQSPALPLARGTSVTVGPRAPAAVPHPALVLGIPQADGGSDGAPNREGSGSDQEESSVHEHATFVINNASQLQEP